MSESFTIQVADSLRRFEPNSPRSSPRGNRSPVVPRQQDSTGTLKTTISLGKTPTIVHTGPFYLHKELPGNWLHFISISCYLNQLFQTGDSDLTGATNLMAHYNLEHSYNKFSGKKFKDSLSSFLPSLPGMIDTPGNADNSSLRSIIEKPPIGGKSLDFLNISQLSGFRLHPGPVPQLISTNMHSVFVILLLSIFSYLRNTTLLLWLHRKRSRNTKSTKRVVKYRRKNPELEWLARELASWERVEPALVANLTKRSIRNKSDTKMRKIARRRRRKRRKRNRSTAQNIQALRPHSTPQLRVAIQLECCLFSNTSCHINVFRIYVIRESINKIPQNWLIESVY